MGSVLRNFAVTRSFAFGSGRNLVVVSPQPPGRKLLKFVFRQNLIRTNSYLHVVLPRVFSTLKNTKNFKSITFQGFFENLNSCDAKKTVGHSIFLVAVVWIVFQAQRKMKILYRAISEIMPLQNKRFQTRNFA